MLSFLPSFILLRVNQYLQIIFILSLTISVKAQTNPGQRALDQGDSLIKQNLYQEALVHFKKAGLEYQKSNNTSKVLYALDGERVCHECLNEFEKALATARRISDEAQASNTRFGIHFVNCGQTLSGTRLRFMEQMNQIAFFSKESSYGKQRITSYYKLLKENYLKGMESSYDPYWKVNFSYALSYLILIDFYVPPFVGKVKNESEKADSARSAVYFGKSLLNKDSASRFLWKSSELALKSKTWDQQRMFQFAEHWKSEPKLDKQVSYAYSRYYISKKEFDKALEFAEGYRGRDVVLEKAEAWKKGDLHDSPDSTLARAMFDKANALRQSASYDSALKYYGSAAMQYMKINHWKQYLNALMISGTMVKEQKLSVEITPYIFDLNTPWDYYSHAFDVAAVIYPETEIQADIYFHLGEYFRDTDDPDESMQDYEHALSIYLKDPAVHPQEPLIAFRMGNFYEYQDDAEEAIRYYNKALSLAQGMKKKNPKLEADCYEGIAHNHYYSGQYPEALSFLDQSEKVNEPAKDKPRREAALNTVRGNVYFGMSNAERAIQYYTKAMEYYKASKDTINELLIYNNFIHSVWDNNNLYDLGPIIKRAYKLLDFDAMTRKPNPLLKEMGIRFLNIAAGGLQRKSYTLEYVSRAIMLNFYREVDFGEYDPTGLNDPPLGSSRDPQLDAYFSGSLLLESYQLRSEILMGKFRKKKDTKALAFAMDTYLKSDSLIDRMRIKSVSESAKLNVASEASALYESAIGAAAEAYAATRNEKYKSLAFHFIEKSKAGVLRNALAEVEVKAGLHIPDSLLRLEKNIKAKINNLDLQISQTTNPEIIEKANDQLFALNQDLKRVWKTYESTYPSYYTLKHSNTAISPDGIMQKLQADEALIEYFMGEEHLYAAVISKDKFEVITMPLDSSLSKNITALRNSITLQLGPDFTKYSHTVYTQIFALVRKQFSANIKKLFIVPDGLLNYLPFEALVSDATFSNYTSLPYLIKDYEISYGLSATLFFAENKQRPEAPKTCIAFAPVFTDANNTNFLVKSCDRFYDNTDYQRKDTRAFSRDGNYISPLPSTEVEVKNITQMLQDKNLFARYFLFKDAREEVIKSSELSQYQYIHFATHGMINDKNPQLSGLLLSQDTTSTEDGILYAGEIYGLNLNANLVVLSACETGLGKIVEGEGVLGLTRGWLYAGAKNLIVSLWKVADQSTSDLMIGFYNDMLDGHTKSGSLRSAKQKLINGTEYASPFYWAPFVLIGK